MSEIIRVKEELVKVVNELIEEYDRILKNYGYRTFRDLDEKFHYKVYTSLIGLPEGFLLNYGVIDTENKKIFIYPYTLYQELKGYYKDIENIETQFRDIEKVEDYEELKDVIEFVKFLYLSTLREFKDWFKEYGNLFLDILHKNNIIRRYWFPFQYDNLSYDEIKYKSEELNELLNNIIRDFKNDERFLQVLEKYYETAKKLSKLVSKSKVMN